MGAARFQHIDSIRWHILDALADDWESPEQIKRSLSDFYGSVPANEELGDILQELFEKHYIFLTLNTIFDREEVMRELRGETSSRRFWFGRTDIGYMAWEALSEKYVPQKTES